MTGTIVKSGYKSFLADVTMILNVIVLTITVSMSDKYTTKLN